MGKRGGAQLASERRIVGEGVASERRGWNEDELETLQCELVWRVERRGERIVV
jgi:hypothetical protein